MKLQSVHVDAFGALLDAQLDDLQPGLNICFGPAGTGKTSLVRFLRAVMCGFSEARQLGLMRPSRGRVRSCVRVTHGDLVFDCHRDVASDRFSAVLVGDSLPLPAPVVFEPAASPRLAYCLYMPDQVNNLDLAALIKTAADTGIALMTPVGEQTIDTDETPFQSPAASPSTASQLNRRRRQLQVELQELTVRRRQLSAFAADAQTAHQQELQRLHERMNWWDCEFQAAETALYEAETRLWNAAAAEPRSAPLISSLRLRKRPNLSHLSVDHTNTLEDLDRRIADARTELIQVAQQRMQTSVKLAELVGLPVLSSEQLIEQFRSSLALIEDTLEELEQNAEGLDELQGSRQITKGAYLSTIRTAITASRLRLETAHERILQFERRTLRESLESRLQVLQASEQRVLHHMECLLQEREEFVVRTGNLPSWRSDGSDQRLASAPAAGDCPEHTSAMSASQAEWPLVARLRSRRNQLATVLELARREWRNARNVHDRDGIVDELIQLESLIEHKTAELQCLDKELTQATPQRRSITSEAQHGQSQSGAACLQWAGEYLSRLTHGRTVSVSIVSCGEEPQFTVHHGRGGDQTLQSCSQGLQSYVALSLRLALVRAFAKCGVRFPLILDDVFPNADRQQCVEMSQLLQEFCEQQQQQIVCLTSVLGALEAATSVGAHAHLMPDVTVESVANTLEESSRCWSIQGWVDGLPGRAKTSAELSTVPFTTGRGSACNVPRSTQGKGEARPTVASSFSAPMSPPLQHPASPPHSGVETYSLSRESPLSCVPSLGDETARRLNSLGIQTVQDLLDRDVEEFHTSLTALQIDPMKFRDWQAECLLLSSVPDLTGREAEFLVLCGVVSPQQLAQFDVAQLLSQCDRFSRRARSATGSVVPTRDDVQRWIQAARHARAQRAA